ncbi:hypothetical protein [Hymenobacter sublimis]|uniref:Uncharacterized protein n=1 Tax=Hymenobacter sublimis TaxID=2933777 RepID=A0ABY4J465_9BACT|nr:hypothetical protein [Hymenobacter sublimis]UPL47634.1 hypothetical protein MWH26_10535 [Hymenobacter sublimis]
MVIDFLNYLAVVLSKKANRGVPIIIGFPEADNSALRAESAVMQPQEASPAMLTSNRQGTTRKDC